MTVKKVPTVLLVDDDANIVSVVRQALVQVGCVLLSAATPGSARPYERGSRDDRSHRFCKFSHERHELAERLLVHRPDLPIVFISGDSEAELLATDSTFPNQLVVQKPFLPSELAARVMSLSDS